MQKFVLSIIFFYVAGAAAVPANPLVSNITVCKEKRECVDCYTARVCLLAGHGGNTLYEAERYKCGPAAPFCNPNTGTCQAEAVDYSCTSVNLTIPCQLDGFFPSPDNCSAYHVCHGGVAHSFTCNGYFYDASSEACTQRSCYSQPFRSCSSQSSSVLAVPNIYDNSYYGFCINGTVLAVDKCPTSYVFNITTQRCEPSCERISVFPDLSDTSKYYVCGRTLSSSGYELSHHSCADEYFFSAYYRKCEKRFTPPEMPEAKLDSDKKKEIHLQKNKQRLIEEEN